MEDAELAPFRGVWAIEADLADEQEEKRTGRPLFPDRPMSSYDQRRLRKRNGRTDDPPPAWWDGEEFGEWPL